jgi:hypothetical protein
MRNILVASALILVSQASFSASKNFNIKYGANSGGFGLGPAIEYKVNKNMTVGLLSEKASLTIGTVSGVSNGIGFNARLYSKGALKQGSYIHASYVKGTVEANNSSLLNSVSFNVTSLNFTIGTTSMWNNGFNTDVSLGIRKYLFGTIKTTGSIKTSALEAGFQGVSLSTSFTIGYAF